MNKFKLITLMLFASAAFGATTTFQTDTLQFGKPTNANKTLFFKRNSSTPPAIRWNESGAAMEFTNDGTTFVPLSAQLDQPYDETNCSVANTVATSALTIHARVKGGTDPISGDACNLSFRSSTLNAGIYNHRVLSSALSFTISSGTKLDFIASIPQDLYFYIIDSDGLGTLKVAAATNRVDETVNQSTVAESFTGTVTIASPGVWTATAHGLPNGAAVSFTTTGALPTGIVSGTTYFVVNRAANTFQFAATQGGTAINTTGAQSGTHTIHIADGRLVSDAVYSNVPVRAIGRGSYTITTPGTWLIATMLQPGALFHLPARKHFKLFTATGTWYTPPGTTTNTVYKITCVGGGGSGGGSTGSTGAGAGGGGGGAIKYASNIAADIATSVTVGAGGGGVGAGSGPGNAGGTTTVTSLCVATGGAAGQDNGGDVVGGAGGIGTTGDVLLQGTAGGGGYTVTGVANLGGPGGASALGGGGGSQSHSGTAGGAGNRGGGGGGGGPADGSGSGGAGFVLIEWNQ